MSEFSEPDGECSPVREVPDHHGRVVHESGFVDPSDHNSVGDAFFTESSSPCSDAEYADICKGVAEFFECGVVLARQADGVDGVAF